MNHTTKECRYINNLIEELIYSSVLWGFIQQGGSSQG